MADGLSAGELAAIRERQAKRLVFEGMARISRQPATEDIDRLLAEVERLTAENRGLRRELDAWVAVHGGGRVGDVVVQKSGQRMVVVEEAAAAQDAEDEDWDC